MPRCLRENGGLIPPRVANLRSVAQFVRASRSGREGRRLKSCHSDQVYVECWLESSHHLRSGEWKVGCSAHSRPSDNRITFVRQVALDGVSTGNRVTTTGCEELEGGLRVRSLRLATDTSSSANGNPRDRKSVAVLPALYERNCGSDGGAFADLIVGLTR